MSSDWSNWIIAGATVGNFVVYFLLWRQTRALFLESNAPLLSVVLRNCAYSEVDRGMKMRIVIANSGTVAANQVKLAIRFGGSNERRTFDDIAIPPKSRIPFTFLLSMGHEQYANGRLVGNRLNSIVEGSYLGVGGRIYTYNERQEYDPDLDRFVPTRTWTAHNSVKYPSWMRFLLTASA